MKLKIVPELRRRISAAGKMAEFNACYERFRNDGMDTKKSKDAAIDAVCPELKQFKSTNRRKGETETNGSTCNGYRMLEWVVENYEHSDDANEKKAPSRASWAILMACKRDEDTYRDVLKKYMDSKLKLDLSQGDTETRKYDGQSEYDILEGMLMEL